MKDKDYENIIELTYMGGGFIPANDKAREFTEQCTKGEIIPFKELTQRDISFHRCYFSIINYIYEYLPKSFQKFVNRDNFYKFLKHLKGNYKILFTFKDGTKLVEYDSISFGNMSQKRFEEYIKEQLPWIYENVIGAFFEGDIYNNIINDIEAEYERFFLRLG